ncbi:methyltransferase domain-containing protein [Achromobacter dolens]|uniref:methyltransferase domain-containing protein n=1 Tax=Achromobacter dolens TaxID=1287738 RepID=UPI0006C47212|nr:methyltransferase domain-containing protein [Achromobacter dolens]CAB3866611.1 Trans-aconitate 2-methyltransferase [Achromobacter dolens]CUI34635.1 Malonyl-CoA O-methyltransferase BioC [Achromobacter dolens]
MSLPAPATPPSLPLVAADVPRQFARRGDLSDAQFLYGEVARRMLGRLQYIRVQPQAMLDAGCGAGDNLALLRERYAEAAYTGLDNCDPLLEIARKRHAPAGLSAWIGKLARRGPTNAFINADLAATGLAPESLELVWSNLALHWHREPHAVLAEWRRILRVGGLAMFSCLGPATLRELRQALDDAGLRTATPAFVDMHDFGDLLVENGFADPVMDQEILTLTYRTPEKLLQDVRALGGNPAAGRRGGLVGRDWRARLCDALEAQRRPDGVIALSIEVAYGHAWRAAAHRGTAGETRLSVSAIGGRQRGTP